MSSKLPPVGVRAVVEDFDKYIKNMDSVNKKAEQTGKALEKSASSTAVFGRVFSTIASKLGGFGEKLSDLSQKATGSGAELSALFSVLPPGATALAAVAAGAAVAVTAFVALGTRGAALVGLAESFDRLNQTAGVDAVASLQRLRDASAGTIADFELIRLSNVALAGATGKFGQEFGTNLPRILEIARVQARATGQSVDFLFQSLITGIKRGSPLLIDNTGLVLKVSEANAAMAAQLGKSVEQLTAEEKQLAILNATLAAGQVAIDGFAGVQETSAEKMARMNATITNILDTLAIGVQPAFGMFLDVLNRGLGFVQMLTTALNPLISGFLEMSAALITGPVVAAQALAEPIIKLVSWFLTLTSVILQPVMKAIGALGTAFGTGVTRIVQFLGEWVNNNLGLNFDNLALNFGRGAGAVIGAFGNAILQAYNAVVAPIILFIATAIANFLVGESPPPEGPLSRIDQGGANTMLAWMEGFAGVGLEPVERVAANVNAALGDIGRATLPQVEARLAQLDAALQPFNDQLAIVKANFEAINEPAKAALDAIDRQTAKAMEALARGEAGSAEAVRALDAQRERIEGALGAQQDLVDQAQIQQALARSQQTEERALLTIQQARLKAIERMAGANEAVTKATKDAAEASKGAGAVAAPTPETGAGAAGGRGGALVRSSQFAVRSWGRREEKLRSCVVPPSVNCELRAASCELTGGGRGGAIGGRDDGRAAADGLGADRGGGGD